MFRNTFLLFTGFFILVLIVLSSCNEPAIVENKTKIENEQKLFKNETSNEESAGNKIPVIGKIIGYKIIKENGEERKIPIYGIGSKIDLDEKALDCQYKRIYVDGEFDHYKPKSGKWLGIMNQYSAYKSANELHEKWGFNGYAVSSESAKNTCVNIGYDPDYVMAKIHVDLNGNYTIPNGSFKKYHLDEPFERGYLSRTDVLNISNSIFNLDEQAELFMSSYRKSGDWNNKVADYSFIVENSTNTRIMCDQYYDGTLFYGDDQRPYWSSFAGSYGGYRVKSHWLHLIIDARQSDFHMLFQKANSMGINNLWLFAGDANNGWPGIDEDLTYNSYDTYIRNFCYNAYYNNWLRKFVKRYSYWYRCPDEYGDPCYCFDINPAVI